MSGLSACVLLFRAIVNLFCQFGKLVGMKVKMEGRAAVVQFERMCPALPGVRPWLICAHWAPPWPHLAKYNVAH